MRRDSKSSEPRSGIDRWSTAEASSAPKKNRAKKPHRDSRARRWVASLVVMVVLLGVCAFLFFPPAQKITQGLDIRGGVSVIMTATKSDGSAPSAEDMQTATSIIQSRVNALGASEATVQKQGSNSILIQIPGATDAESAIQTLGRTGLLEFVRLDEIGDAEALAKLNAGTDGVSLKSGTYTAFMDGSHVTSTQVGLQSNSASGTYAVNVSLDDEGTRLFADVTRELAPTKGRIAIVLDGKINSAPAVQSEITGGQVSITGNFTIDEAQSLKTVLDSGSLPVTLTYSESRVVGPTLGQDSLMQGVTAIVIGAAIVIVYLFVFYRGLGILTMGSLTVFAILYLGLLALLSHFGAFALTLPGLAGVVLTTGSAADSSILVLERFREEIRMGKTPRAAAISGSKHGIMTSLDADAVTLVTALALFFVGVGSVKGFGLTLALGIACDIVTMFCFKAPALRLLAQRQIQKHPKFWGIDYDLAEGAAKKDAHTSRTTGTQKGADAQKGGERNA